MDSGSGEHADGYFLYGKDIVIALLLWTHLVMSFDSTYAPFEHLKSAAGDSVTVPGLSILLGGSALALGLATFDSSTRKYFDRHRVLGSERKVGTYYGWWPTQLGLAAIGMGTGFLLSHPQITNAGEAQMEALLFTMGLTGILKYSTHRMRPDGVDEHSFPSDHASTSFATAVVYSQIYGPWIGIPAFALAGFTAFSRLDAHKHYLSDIVFGAALGSWLGYSFAGHHKEKSLSLSLIPFFENRKNFGIEGIFRF